MSDQISSDSQYWASSHPPWLCWPLLSVQAGYPALQHWGWEEPAWTVLKRLVKSTSYLINFIYCLKGSCSSPPQIQVSCVLVICTWVVSSMEKHELPVNTFHWNKIMSKTAFGNVGNIPTPEIQPQAHKLELQTNYKYKILLLQNPFD